MFVVVHDAVPSPIPYTSAKAYNGSMSGVGPTATMRVGLTCAGMRDSSRKRLDANLGLRPIIMDFDVLEIRRRLECVIIPVQPA